MELIHLLWRFEDGERVKRAALHFHAYLFPSGCWITKQANRFLSIPVGSNLR